MPKNNPDISPLPPDALALLQDPRLEGQVEVPAHPFLATRVLQPAVKPSGESRFLAMYTSSESDPNFRAQWVNRPERALYPSPGTGFAKFPALPRVEVSRKSPKRLFHLAELQRTNYYVASPDMVELLRVEVAGSFETHPVEWVFNDNQALDGYVLLDFVTLHHAFDYAQSVVSVSFENGRKFPQLNNNRVIRADIPAHIRVFRDACHRNYVFVDRSLAAKMLEVTGRDVYFTEVFTGGGFDAPRPKGRRKLLAKLKPAVSPEYDESMPLHRKMDLRIVPWLREGKFAEAEALLSQWLRAKPGSPCHVVADLDVTTPPAECAQYLDAYVARDPQFAALFIEMNEFTINPDRWFCDVFGFYEHEGTDDFAWLANFRSCAMDEGLGTLTITGLEPVQAAYAARRAGGPQTEDLETDNLVQALVIVKFQKWLQRSLPLMKAVRCPLLASAHEFEDFIVEIAPRP